MEIRMRGLHPPQNYERLLSACNYNYHVVDRSACRAVVRLIAASAAVLASVVALDRSDEVSIGCMYFLIRGR